MEKLQKMVQKTVYKHLNTNSYDIVHMSKQISMKLSNNMFLMAKTYAQEHGYDSLQDFIRETLREKLYDNIDVNEEYIKKLESKEANTFSSFENSKKFVEGLRKKARLK